MIFSSTCIWKASSLRVPCSSNNDCLPSLLDLFHAITQVDFLGHVMIQRCSASKNKRRKYIISFFMRIISITDLFPLSSYLLYLSNPLLSLRSMKVSLGIERNNRSFEAKYLPSCKYCFNRFANSQPLPRYAPPDRPLGNQTGKFISNICYWIGKYLGLKTLADFSRTSICFQMCENL